MFFFVPRTFKQGFVAIWATIPHFRARKRTFHDECAFGALVFIVLIHKISYLPLISECNVSNRGLTDFFRRGGLMVMYVWDEGGGLVVAAENPVSFSLRFP